MTAPTSGHPVRTCIACAKTDDHPRHVIDVGGGDTVTFHMDCHIIANGCEVCTAQLAEAPQGAKGQELREFLVTTGPGRGRPGWTPPGLEDDDSPGNSGGNSGNQGNSGGGKKGGNR